MTPPWALTETVREEAELFLGLVDADDLDFDGDHGAGGPAAFDAAAVQISHVLHFLELAS